MHHPALKAVAPWEGYTDLFRHYVTRGGRLYIPGLHRMILNGFAGPEGVKNVGAMLEKRPLYEDYWEAKRIPVENIDNIPILSDKPRPEKKWLRVHPFQEYGSSATTVVERPERSYPLTRQRLRTLYLDGTTGTLVDLEPNQEYINSYEGRSLSNGLTFIAKFDVTTELAGYPKAVLLMLCPDHDNFDVVVQIRKIDNKGRQLSHLNYPCPVAIDQVPDVNTAKTWGPQGFLRASHHISLNAEGGLIVSDDSSHETDVFYSHRVRQPITPGTTVRIEIPIWPIGLCLLLVRA
ncbi:hypothetical protein ACJA88_002132 [Fusarium oxysporum]